MLPNAQLYLFQTYKWLLQKGQPPSKLQPLRQQPTQTILLAALQRIFAILKIEGHPESMTSAGVSLQRTFFL